MPNSYTSLVYHIVFGTKHRVPQITGDVAPSLYAYMAGIIKNLDGKPIIIGGVEDHVHILTVLGQSRAVDAVVRDLKANSSRWVHGQFPDLGDFAWQSGGGSFTVRVKGIPAARRYIEGQQAHHREVSFREELVGFLKMHDIPYDERYV